MPASRGWHQGLGVEPISLAVQCSDCGTCDVLPLRSDSAGRSRQPNGCDQKVVTQQLRCGHAEIFAEELVAAPWGAPQIARGPCPSASGTVLVASPPADLGSPLRCDRRRGARFVRHPSDPRDVAGKVATGLHPRLPGGPAQSPALRDRPAHNFGDFPDAGAGSAIR